MADQTRFSEPDGFANNATEGFETALAMLLLTRRMRVNDFNLIGSGLASVIFSGEAIEKELAVFSQIPTISEQDKSKKKHKDTETEDADTFSFWQAFKEFALPPYPKKR